MKEMANIQAGMSFYGEMPDMFNLVLNSDHKLIKQVLDEEEAVCHPEVAPIQTEMNSVSKRRNELKDSQKDKKEEEARQAHKREEAAQRKEHEELFKKVEAALGTIRLLAYSRMSEEIERLLTQGYATPAERRVLDEMFKNYKSHGWNGDMDARLGKVYSLRTDHA